ncbi:MAG TPA: hypothetical protein VJ578_04745 [Dehalococcoidia bacterium]|nr:hypothetical protein [Dehalococcoidia bacterium]
MYPIRSNLLRDHTSATEIIEIDLPTNPLSHLILTVSGYQMTDEATLAEILAFLNTVNVSDQGKTIINVQSEDLYALNCYLYKRHPVLTNNITTDNATRSLGLIIPFGRRVFDPTECYPARKKGDVTLYADMTALGTSIDNGIINIDCVQLPDAAPSHYLRSRTMTKPASGVLGDNDFPLPIGEEIVALQLRETTFPATSSHAYGVDKISIEVDEVEQYYSAATAECLIADGIFRHGGKPLNMLLQQQQLPTNIVWVDFDPTGNGEYLLQTKGKSSVKAVLEMGVNEATYITVLERVAVVG